MHDASQAALKPPQGLSADEQTAQASDDQLAEHDRLLTADQPDSAAESAE